MKWQILPVWLFENIPACTICGFFTFLQRTFRMLMIRNPKNSISLKENSSFFSLPIFLTRAKSAMINDGIKSKAFGEKFSMGKIQSFLLNMRNLIWTLQNRLKSKKVEKCFLACCLEMVIFFVGKNPFYLKIYCKNVIWNQRLGKR